MTSADYENNLCKQVLSVPALLRELYPGLEAQTRKVLATPVIYSIKKVVLTGAGDCYAAALCAKPLFERFLGIPIEVVPPLELARSYQMKWVGESPCDPLVIAMSNSGRAARVVEAAQRMRAHNALTLAITGDESSPLAQACETMVKLDIPAFDAPAPGARSYTAVLAACLLLAIRFGEVRLRYTMDTANSYRREMLRLADELEARAEEWQSTAFTAAAYWKDATALEAVGGSYSNGTAYYAAAKAYEAIGIPGVPADSETWFHLHYFVRDIENTMLFLFDEAENECASRTEELLRRLTSMGRRFALVSDRTGDIPEPAFHFALPQTEHGFLLPLVAWAPAALTAGYTAAVKGEIYSRGFAGIWEEAEGEPSTTNSKMNPMG